MLVLVLPGLSWARCSHTRITSQAETDWNGLKAHYGLTSHLPCPSSLNGIEKLTTAEMEANDYIHENVLPDQTTRARNFEVMYLVEKFMEHI